MAPLKNLSALVDSLFPFRDFLFILQKEEYETGRYFRFLPRFFFRRCIRRQEQLVWTKRVLILFLLSLLLWVGIVVSLVATTTGILLLVLLFISLLCIPLCVVFANMVLFPLFALAHRVVEASARESISRRPNMRIVAIAGSFGKTTTKYFLYELVRHSFKTQLIPENINTTSGIASWVRSKLSGDTELLIVEMDTYRKGELARSARITPPDIAIITNIGDQHLERFGTRERLAEALGEVFTSAKPHATCITTAETAELVGLKSLRMDVTKVLVPPAGETLYRGTELSVNHLSDSNRSNLRFALSGADALGIPVSFVTDTVAKLVPPDRRQLPTVLYGYDAIDDSYNISFTTAKAGVEAGRALANKKGKKLLVVTAGIPEVGPHEQEGNQELGKLLSDRADHVAVLKTLFADTILKGGKKEKMTRYKNLNAFLAKAPTLYPKESWVVLFQPSLSDLYY